MYDGVPCHPCERAVCARQIVVVKPPGLTRWFHEKRDCMPPCVGLQDQQSRAGWAVQAGGVNVHRDGNLSGSGATVGEKHTPMRELYVICLTPSCELGCCQAAVAGRIACCSQGALRQATCLTRSACIACQVCPRSSRCRQHLRDERGRRRRSRRDHQRRRRRRCNNCR